MPLIVCQEVVLIAACKHCLVILEPVAELHFFLFKLLELGRNIRISAKWIILNSFETLTVEGTLPFLVSVVLKLRIVLIVFFMFVDILFVDRDFLEVTKLYVKH